MAPSLPPPPSKTQVREAKELLRKSAQFVRSQSALWATEWEMKLREGVYPPVAMEIVHNGLKLKEINGVPWEDDGEECPTRD
jgi:hypothetical protein